MNGPELLAYCGDDASKWAAEFCKIARDRGLRIDEEWMTGWFANAIEHSWDVRTHRNFEENPPQCRPAPEEDF